MPSSYTYVDNYNIFFEQGLVAKVLQEIEGAQGQKIIQFQPPSMLQIWNIIH